MLRQFAEGAGFDALDEGTVAGAEEGEFELCADKIMLACKLGE